MRTILEMVHHTRLDCVTRQRRAHAPGARAGAAPRAPPPAFGRRLAEQPLMRNVLADLALESEAATALMLRLARAYDEAPRDAGRARLRAHRDRRRQVLGLQARAARDRRGDGVPRRQRLRRGVDPAAALPRGAGQRDLGGLGQRDLPRRAARDRRASRTRCRRCSTSCARARRRPRLDAALRGSRPTSPIPPTPSRARATSSSGWRWRSRPRCCCASRRRRSPTPSVPRAWAAAGGYSARSRRAPISPRFSPAHCRNERLHRRADSANAVFRRRHR